MRKFFLGALFVQLLFVLTLVNNVEVTAVSGANQVAITISKDKIDSDLVDFPVSVYLDSTNFDFTTVNSNGSDIYFTDLSGNLLRFDVEYFDDVNERALYYVESDLSSSTDNIIMLNKGSATDYSTGNLTNEMWSSNYRTVNHFGQNASTFFGTITRSIVSTLGSPSVATDAFGGNGSTSFDGIDDAYSVGSTMYENRVTSDYAFTIVAKIDNNVLGQVIYGEQGAEFPLSDGYVPQIVVLSDGKIQGANWTNDVLSSIVTSSSAYNDGEYHVITLISDASSVAGSDALYLYIDGVLSGSLVGTDFVEYHTTTYYYSFGGGTSSSGWNTTTTDGASYADIDIDEFRTFTSIPTTAWIKAEALSLKNELSSVGATYIGGSTTNGTHSSTNTVLDANLTITSSSSITTAKVQINNLKSGDTLSGTGCSYDSTKGILTCSASDTTTLESNLQGVIFSTTSTDNTTREFAITLGSAIVSEDTGHFYEYISGSYTWTEAETAAGSRTLYGLEGYLATITSLEENTFIQTKLGSDAWIGATDQAVEGEWRWVTGPEGLENSGQGRLIGTATTSNNTVTSYVASTYDKWNDNEPNDYFSNEDFAEIYIGTDGRWNDLGSSSQLGYVVEYGGMTNDPINILSYSRSIDISTKITKVFNDGATSDEISYYNSGSVINSITDPTRTGYTFSNWYSDSGLTTTLSLPYTVTTTNDSFYAKWTANTYTVTFNKNGGTGGTDSVQMTYDQPFPSSVNIPSKTGYSFNGYNHFLNGSGTTYWDENGDTTRTTNWSGTKDYTFYAQWNINQYTMSFNSNGGSSVSDITQDYLSNVTEPTNPTRTGYNFGGWYSDSELTNLYTFGTMPASDTTLYAKWLINSFSLTFVENGGSDVADSNEEYDTSITKPTDPTKTGYTFSGWYSDSELTLSQSFPFNMPAANKSVYAKWSIMQYTMSFNSNGGSSVSDITQDYDSNITSPTPTRLGYAFVGWFSDSSLTNQYTITTMPASDTTLYAKWEVRPFVITFDTNGGSSVSDISANYDDSITEPDEPTKTSNEFEGWYTDQTYSTEFVFTTMPSYDLTLYAKWKQIGVTIPLIRTLNLEIAEEVTIQFGENPNIEYEAYSLYGYYKTDLTDNVEIIGDYDINTPGTYELTYIVEYNEEVVSKTVKLIVEDKTKPTINITDIKAIYGYEVEYTLDVEDNCEHLEVDVQTKQVGLTNYIYVTATDASGNVTEEVIEVPIRFARKQINIVSVLNNQLVFVASEVDFDLDSLQFETVINKEDMLIEITMKDDFNNSIVRTLKLYELVDEVEIDVTNYFM